MQPFVVENFISRDTAIKVHEYLKPKSIDHVPDGPHPKGIRHLGVNPKEKKSWSGESKEDNLIFDIISLLTSAIASKFGLPSSEINLRTIRYTLLTEGQSLSFHDDYQVSGYPVHSAVLYLTDDYEGGEIEFYDFEDSQHIFQKPKSHVAYKPKAGTLMYFDGDLEHPHKVNEVISGERANFVIFYEGIGSKPTVEEITLKIVNESNKIGNNK